MDITGCQRSCSLFSALVQRFEHACVSSTVHPDDQLLLACFLLMCWGGLRFSDAQRLDLRSVVCCEEAIRGRCWRTKSSPRGMCSGFLRRGCLARDWGGIFFNLISSLRTKYPRRDHLLAVKGRPMMYTQCLAHLRRCLVVFGGLAVGVASAKHVLGAEDTMEEQPLASSCRK